MDYYPYGSTRVSQQLSGFNEQKEFIGQYQDPTATKFRTAVEWRNVPETEMRAFADQFVGMHGTNIAIARR